MSRTSEAPSALDREGEGRVVWPRREVSPLRLREQLCVVTSGLFIGQHEAEPGLRVSELLFPGDVVAEGEFGARAPGSIVAATAGRVVTLEFGEFQKLLVSESGGTRWLLEGMAIRVKRAENRQINQMSADTRTRLAGFLVEWCQVNSTVRLPGPYQGGLAQAVVAEVIGATRATVNRTLQGLERRGVVALVGGGITVVDFDVLARCAREAEPILHGVRWIMPPLTRAGAADLRVNAGGFRSVTPQPGCPCSTARTPV